MEEKMAGKEKKTVKKNTNNKLTNTTKSSPAAKSIGIDKTRIRTLRILAFVIPALLVLLGMLAGSFAPFGTKDVMTAGGNAQQLTYYYELYDRVHEGKDLVYSLSSGTGYDFTSIFTYYLSDPLNLIILIFPRTAIPAVINLLYALKLGLAGLFFSIFLTRRKARIEANRAAMEETRADAIREIEDRKTARKAKAKEKAEAKGGKAKTDIVLGGSEEPKSGLAKALKAFDLPILAFSVAYALSAYMLGQGLNVANLSVVALFPLILMALDELMENGKWRLYAALMTASVFCSLQMAIIVFIFSVIYAFLFDHKDVHHAIKGLLLKLISDLLAAGAGAVILLNCLGSTTFHDQVSIKFPLGSSITSFFDVVKNVLPTARASASGANNYGIDIFCGVLSVFLLVLYLGNPNISLAHRLRQSGILLMLGTGFVLVTPNYLFNGFSHPEMTFCLFGFLFVAQLLSIAYEEFMNLRHTPAWQLHVGLAILATLIPCSFLFCDTYDSFSPFLYALEFLAGYYLIFILYRNNSMTRWLLCLITSVLLLLEMGITYVDNLRNAGSVSDPYEASLESQYYEATKLLHQAMPNANIKIYESEYNDDSPVSMTLMNYHFVIVPKEVKNIDPTLRYMTDYKDVSIYENNYSANGVFVPKEVENWSYDSKHPFTSINDFTYNYMKTATAFYTAPGELTVGYLPLYDDNGIEEARRIDYMFQYTPTQDGPLYTSLYGIRYLGEAKADTFTSFYRTFSSWENTPKEFSAEHAFFYKEGYELFCDSLTIPNCETLSESQVRYSINAPEDGYLVLPYSSLSGWKVSSSTLSSVEASTFMDRALMVPVTKGENTVELFYSPTLFYYGILISLAVLVLLILLAVKDRIRIRATAGGIHSLSDWLRDNYVYVITLAVTLLVFLIAQMHTSSIPFGDRSTLAGDGYLQGYYGYRGISAAVKNGSYGPLNWNTGITIDQYNNFLANIVYPWGILKYYLMPDSLIVLDMTLNYLLSFLVPGLSLIFYLTHRRRGRCMDKHDWRLIVLGLAYGLSTYSISYFIYGNFGFLYYLPIMLLAMERLVYDKKPVLYIVLLFSLMGDPYYAFILCEFLALYFFTLEFDGFKDFIRKGLRFAASSVIAAGLACFRLIPFYLKTLDSPYKVEDTVSPITKSGGNYLSVISDYMSHRDAVVSTTDDFRVNYYIGILALLIIPLYLMNRKVPLSVRIRRTVLLSLYFVAFGSRILNYVFHGLHYQALVPNRFAAFFIILLIIMFSECILSWQDYSRRSFCLGISIPAVVLGVLWSVYFCTASKEQLEPTAFCISMILIGAYLILTISQLWKKHKTAFRNAMLALCIVEVILNAMFIFPHSIGETIPDTSDLDQINALAEKHPDMKDPFVATEYISDYYNIAEATNITSDSYFSSNSTTWHSDLFNKWDLLTSSNSTAYLCGNPLADMMLHIKYNISNDTDETSWSHYPIVDRSGMLELHESPYYLPLGIFFKDNAQLEAWDKTDYSDYKDEGGGNAFAYQNAFSHAMGCGDIYHIIQPETDGSKITDENDQDITYLTADPSEYLEGKQTEVPTQIHLAKDMEGEIYFSYYYHMSYAGTTYAGEADIFDMTMYLPLGRKDYYMRIASFDADEMQKLHKKLSESTMTDIETSFSSVRGKIHADDTGTVYLSLPNMDGWTAYVDGQKVESRFFLGGIGVPVTAGDHTIEITYTPHGAWLGIAVSGGVLFLLIAYAVFRKTIVKRRRETESDAHSESGE